MAEIYSFTAKVVTRRRYRIGISPENPDAFMDYLERVGLSGLPHLHNGSCLIWVNNRNMIEAVNGADRVRYSVEKRATRMFGVKMESLT